MKHLIITADDYGVFPSVNEAVIGALEKEKLNSVSVFSNYNGSDKYDSSETNFRKLLDKAANLPFETEFGCHLTITSGRPITGDKMNFVCDDKGYFRSYTEMPNFKKPEQLQALKEELIAQVEYLERIQKGSVRHLTNHHNSLTLFPHHYDVYMEVARLMKIPMRSACVRPELKQNIYLRFLNYSLKDDIHAIDREKLRDFATKIVSYFNDNANGVKAPQVLDSRHYGPLSFLPVRLAQPLLVSQKRKNLDALFSDFTASNDNSIELLLHLATPKWSGVDTSKDLDYPGVDRGYFDSRVIEYLSITGYDIKKWKDITVKVWKYL